MDAPPPVGATFLSRSGSLDPQGYPSVSSFLPGFAVLRDRDVTPTGEHPPFDLCRIYKRLAVQNALGALNSSRKKRTARKNRRNPANSFIEGEGSSR